LNKDKNLQKEDKTIKQDQKLLMEEENHPWILGSLKTNMTKTENLYISITMYINIWQRIANSQRKKRKSESATNVTK